MVSYKLKPEHAGFRPVNGPCKGVRYVHGELYRRVPPDSAYLFDQVGGGEEAAPPAAKDAPCQVKRRKAQEVSDAA